MQKSREIGHPRFLIEINCKEPTSFIRQERIYPYGVLPCEVLPDHLGCQREKHACLASDVLAFLWPSSIDRTPIHGCCWRIPRFPAFRLPSNGVNVLSRTKQALEQGDFFFWSESTDYGLDDTFESNLGARSSSISEIWDAKHGAQTRILFSESFTFFLGSLRLARNVFSAAELKADSFLCS